MANARSRRKMADPEAREQQLISLSENLAEQKLRDGTASSQLIIHYLKLGTTKAALEKEKLRKENNLLEAKTSAIYSAEETKQMIEDAIKAITKYGGHGDPDEYEDY